MLIEPLQLASFRLSQHHSGVAKRDNINLSYDPALHGDLKAKLRKLQGIRQSRFYGRSLADTAGMLLADALDLELTKQEAAAALTQISQTPVIEEPPIEITRGAS